MVQTRVTEQYGINEQAGSARRGVRVVYGDGLEKRLGPCRPVFPRVARPRFVSSAGYN